MDVDGKKNKVYLGGRYLEEYGRGLLGPWRRYALD